MAERNGKGDWKARPRVEVGKLFEKEPPSSPEAEMGLLGSIILDPAVISDVLPLVPGPESFYSAGHGSIYQSLLELYEHQPNADLVQLVDHLRDKGVLKDVGGEAYLAELAEGVPASINAPHYARLVADKHRLRRLIDETGKILYEAYHPGEAGSVAKLLDKAEAAVLGIAESGQSTDAQSLADLLQEEIDRIEELKREGVSGLRTGFHDLDEMLSGLQKGEMLIVAARPSMGKTALALNLAEQVALGGAGPGERAKGDPVSVALFSLEMSRSSVASRMLSARSGIDSHRMRSGKVSENDFRTLMHASGELGEAPIFIDDSPNLSIMGLRSRARRLKHRHKIGCIVIDYLQLLTSPNAARESRQVEVSEISRGVKALARELELPVICLAQLNRGPEQREGNRPRLADLRESGSIEQDADVVMLLHREEYFHIGDPDWEIDNPDKKGLAELIIAKQRNGPTGTVNMIWDSRTTRFKNFAGGSAGGGGDGSWAHTPADTGGWVPQVDFPEGGAPTPTPPPAEENGNGHRPGGFFRPGNKTGPASDHRDGGGPDKEWADDDIPI